MKIKKRTIKRERKRKKRMKIKKRTIKRERKRRILDQRSKGSKNGKERRRKITSEETECRVENEKKTVSVWWLFAYP